jgi:hypothetical protein
LDEKDVDCGILPTIFNLQFSIFNIIRAAEAAEKPAQDGTTATTAEEEFFYFFVGHVYSCADILPHGSGYA